MEVIIFSNNTERRTGLKKLTDRIIMDKRLRLMSLHTSAPENPSELEKQIIADKGYLVIMDITGYPDWKNVILRISAKCRRVRFCLISGSDSAAAEAINLMLDICGYVNASSGDILCSLEAVLVRIYGRITTVCGGIMTFGEDGGLKIISFADIYYIETIKQQHRCTIYHKKGTDTMRADISKLIGSLDGRFEITRSSTIANLSAVKEISDGMICFEDGSCCGVSAKRLSVIKRVMRELAAL
ncbi:MAG: LytTR family DNA-binding domain-containing protein [Oscillospiraceae bacterium]|nr:LytTR family DNA-binding domain-containing protein [Oscillospiraceae bacterium]